MAKLEVVKVFIASPGDLIDERKLFPDVIERVNTNKAKAMGYLLDAINYEDALPSGGRPQELVNKDVAECDVFVLLFWKRWGSASGKFSSGTEEEFFIADSRFRKEKVPHLLIYFRDPPAEMIADPGVQLRKVRKFRARIEKEKRYLYKPYSKIEEWRDLFEEHLSRWLDLYNASKTCDSAAVTNLVVPQPQVTEQGGPDDLQKQLLHMLELQKKLEAKVVKLETAQNKLRAEAVGIAVEAMKLTDRGQLTLAEEKFTKALALYDEPEVMNNFGYFLWQIGSPDRAKEMFERVLGLEAEQKQSVHDAIAHNRLGNVFMTKGDWKSAKQHYEKALAINTTLKRRSGEADIYISLGNIALNQEHLKQAEDFYKKSLAINLDLGRQEGIADGYLSLGNIDRRRNNLPSAFELYEKALEINLSLGRKERTAVCYTALGIVYRRQDQLLKAEKMHRKALKIDTALGLKENIADDYAGLGNVYITQKDLVRAEKMYLKALAIDTLLGRKEGIALAYNNLGEVHAARGESKQATLVWTRAADLYKELGNSETAKRILTQMRAWQRRGNKKRPARRAAAKGKTKRRA